LDQCGQHDGEFNVIEAARCGKTEELENRAQGKLPTAAEIGI
jgi:hypothetical protein